MEDTYLKRRYNPQLFAASLVRSAGAGLLSVFFPIHRQPRGDEVAHPPSPRMVEVGHYHDDVARIRENLEVSADSGRAPSVAEASDTTLIPNAESISVAADSISVAVAGLQFHLLKELNLVQDLEGLNVMVLKTMTCTS